MHEKSEHKLNYYTVENSSFSEYNKVKVVLVLKRIKFS